MRWVSPSLAIGTSDDALVLDHRYLEGDEIRLAARYLRVGGGVVVATTDEAVTILRALKAPEEWIDRHVLTEWALEPPDDDWEDYHP